MTKRGIGLLNMPRLRTSDGIEKERRTRREYAARVGGEAKGDERRITKESDWKQKEGETKGRMLAF